MSSLVPLTSRLPATAAELAAARPRLDCLDWLRGLVMVIMVLDHTRDFFAIGGFNPRDPNDPLLFLTRWVTHLCAPTFVFLSGISAYLYGARGRTRRELSRFLATRGFWLIILELTLIRLGWTFNLRYDLMILQVIWIIGFSLLVLSGLVFLPRPAIVVFGLALVLGHNLLDGIKADQLGSARWLWMLMHEQGLLQPRPGVTIFVIYPLVPWIGVVALGYVFGPIMKLSPLQRHSACLRLGLLLGGFFLLVRGINIYGDPQPWSVQPTRLATALSFVNCEKYPPSLLFLCMTLGVSMLLLAWAGDSQSKLAQVFVDFGRVPFCFYAAHIFLLHSVAVVWSLGRTGDATWLFRGLPSGSPPAGFGLNLPAIYLLWLVTVAALYPLCRWFARVKQTRKSWWLSYL